MLLDWKDAFSVNVSAIDEEHQKLFDIINRLHTAMTKREAGNIIADTFAELVNYTKTHFAHEEEMMESINYPKLNEHKEMHKKFVDKLSELKDQYDANPLSYTISIEMWIFLRDWLNNHILGVDMEYSPYFE